MNVALLNRMQSRIYCKEEQGTLEQKVSTVSGELRAVNYPKNL